MALLSLVGAHGGGVTLACRLTPSGRIDVQLGTLEDGPLVPGRAAGRITDAFGLGRGHSVLHLGAAELGTELPPSLGFWRDLGQAFGGRVCGLLDPTDPKSLVIPDPDPDELESLIQTVPPMQGAELLNGALLGEIWSDMGAALSAQAKRFEDGVQGYLKTHGSVWNVVGRVCLHLAENKRDPDYPFAFIATYAHKVSRQARPQHLPLGRALKDYAGARNRQKLLALLAPLSRASEVSEFIRELVDSGDIYHPLSWTPKEAHRFLCETALYELGGCLADDMGLGKTIQVLGVLNMSRLRKEKGTDLLVVPASLLDNWRLEIERFAPGLKVLIAHPSRIPSAELKKLSKKKVEAHHAVITSYGTAMRTAWIKEHPWRHVILDEAQAIKNPGTKQTKAIKALPSKWRLALTGTPVENRLGDLWSIFDFLNPGLLGSAKAFTGLCKSMSGSRQGYAPLRRLVQPYILRRLKTDRDVISDLPDKTELTAHCLLSKRQAALYQQSVVEMKKAIEKIDGIARKGVVLAFLMRLKQICNHPSQWLSDGEYQPAARLFTIKSLMPIT